jgi:hypothetical protein
MNKDENSVDLETLLAITRQNLINSILINTELEALVQELKSKIKELEEKKDKDK